jgi:hypothetical protein
MVHKLGEEREVEGLESPARRKYLKWIGAGALLMGVGGVDAGVRVYSYIGKTEELRKNFHRLLQMK